MQKNGICTLRALLWFLLGSLLVQQALVVRRAFLLRDAPEEEMRAMRQSQLLQALQTESAEAQVPISSDEEVGDLASEKALDESPSSERLEATFTTHEDLREAERLKRIALELKEAWRDRVPSKSRLRDDCLVPCFIEGKRGLVGSFKFSIENHTSATLMHSMEGPQHYSALRDKGIHDGLACTSFLSDIPLPYYSWAEYDIKNPPVDPEAVIQGASFAARNCASLNNREGLVRKMQEFMRVDCVSSCLNNAPWPKGIARSNKLAMMRGYLFHFAFENECSGDYVTEKVWGALASGALPLYYGASNIEYHVPEYSVVNANSFKNWDELSKYLQYLMSNRTAYMEYHAWRSKPWSARFKDTHYLSKTHSECRACKWLYAKTHNLGWSHFHQEIIWKEGALFEKPRRLEERHLSPYYLPLKE